MSQPAEPACTVSDDEIIADLYRLARSGRFRKVASLLKEAKSMYAAEPMDRLKTCLQRLGELLTDAGHGEDASEHQHVRHLKCSGLQASA